MYRRGGPERRLRPTAGQWFAGFTIASLLLLLASSTEPVRTMQRAAGELLDPARQAVGAVGQTIADAGGAIGDIGRLRVENDELRRELAGAQQRVAALTEAARENQELRELLGISRALDMELLPVRVTGREPSNFVQEASVDAGTDHGVHPGMPVLGNAEGGAALVGTVIDATSSTARVRFIVDTRSVVIALDQETRALGEIRGQAGGQLVFANVPATERLATGDTVVTAGIIVADDSSRYPGGLLIGRIQAVEPDVNAVTQTGFVRPALDPSELERLLILLAFEQG
ncbi:MAG: rod shape-determining protein MreC [Chloroflexi bacterium]|nr:rod shape-determining protein MreC [Chloroflexota bacterium]